ncbi:hypothetical protein D3C73_1303040 [compost metagenome]
MYHSNVASFIECVIQDPFRGQTNYPIVLVASEYLPIGQNLYARQAPVAGGTSLLFIIYRGVGRCFTFPIDRSVAV